MRLKAPAGQANGSGASQILMLHLQDRSCRLFLPVELRLIVSRASE